MDKAQVGSLAARLLWLNEQKKAIEEEASQIKTNLEEAFTANGIAARHDSDVLFSDGQQRKARLQRKANGTYFKVHEAHKDLYAKELQALQASYLDSGKAENAQKSHSWNVQVVNG
jgi:hypothetical protein